MSRGGDWIHPPTRYAIVWFRDGGRCQACGWRPKARFGVGLTLDHLLPPSRARSYAHAKHDPRLLVTLCHACNSRKGGRSAGATFGAKIAIRLFARAARTLTRWHRRRGYLAAVRTGRYRVAYGKQKRKALRDEQRYLQLEREGIREGGGG